MLLSACSSSAGEQQLLINFFRAARLHDQTVLANISAVSFDPRTNGSVQQFHIASIGPERRRPAGSDQATIVSSLTPPGQPDTDLTNMGVEVIAKDVTVSAQVRTPDGRMTPRTFVFTMERAVASDRGQRYEGRWMIAGLRQQ